MVMQDGVCVLQECQMSAESVSSRRWQERAGAKEAIKNDCDAMWVRHTSDTLRTVANVCVLLYGSEGRRLSLIRIQDKGGKERH